GGKEWVERHGSLKLRQRAGYVSHLEVDEPEVVVEACVPIVKPGRSGTHKLGEPEVALFVVKKRKILVGLCVVDAQVEHPPHRRLSLVEIVDQSVGHREVVEKLYVILLPGPLDGPFIQRDSLGRTSGREVQAPQIEQRRVIVGV